MVATAFVLLCLAVVACYCAGAHARALPKDIPPTNLWPLPKQVTTSEAGSGPLVFSKVSVSVDDNCDSRVTRLSDGLFDNHRVYYETPRTWPSDLYTQPGRPNLTYYLGEPSTTDNLPHRHCYVPEDPQQEVEVSISCAATLDGVGKEGYTLTVEQGTVAVRASTPQGAAYGMQSLKQLLEWSDELGAHVINTVPLAIEDGPSYEWRGLMIDTGRHYISTSTIIALLHTMHENKLNVLHWHIVESVSFPWESKSHPELSKEGAFTQQSVYTSDDVAAVLNAAEQLFIEVIPEIDTPAHTMSWAKSHPEVFPEGCWEWVRDEYAKIDNRFDAIALDPTNPQAFSLVTDVLTDVKKQFPSAYVHIGGDEVKEGCWNASTAVRTYVKDKFGSLELSAFISLQAEWAQRVSDFLLNTGSKRVPVMWQPTAKGPLQHEYDVLPEETVFMSWLNDKSVRDYAMAKKPVVATHGYYTDMWDPIGILVKTLVNEGVDNLSDFRWMDISRWEDMYHVRPTPAGLEEEYQQYVLGGQVCVWGENMDEVNLMERSWTLGAAIGERLWSGDDANDDVLAAYPRLDRFLCYVKGSLAASKFPFTPTPVIPSHCQV